MSELISENEGFLPIVELIRERRQYDLTKLVTLSREFHFESERTNDQLFEYVFSRMRSPFQGSLFLYPSFLGRCPRLTYDTPSGWPCFLSHKLTESFRDEIVSSVVTQFNISAPKWQLYVSPGCNPGKRIPQKNQALKGRSKFFNFHPSLHQ